jgi:hypothetical protein
MSNDLPSRFAIIPVFPSTDTKEAICIGDYKEVMEYIPQSVARDDAMRELDQARLTHDQIAHAQERTRAVQKIFLLEGLKTLTARADSFATRQRERRREVKARRDAAEAKRIADAQAASIKAALDALNAHEHHNTGDLSPIPAKDDRSLSDQGNLPNELSEKVPPAPGTDPVLPGELGKAPDPPVQPISVSLNSEEE